MGTRDIPSLKRISKRYPYYAAWPGAHSRWLSGIYPLLYTPGTEVISLKYPYLELIFMIPKVVLLYRRNYTNYFFSTSKPQKFGRKKK